MSMPGLPKGPVLTVLSFVDHLLLLAVFVAVQDIQGKHFGCALEDHAAEDVVLEVGTDGGRLNDCVYSSGGEHFAVADSGELQDLGSLHYTGAEHYFTGGLRLVGLARDDELGNSR
jgi:hypothetical protein